MVNLVDSWGYPFFSDIYKKEINPRYILVENSSKNYEDYEQIIDYVINTKINQAFILYGNSKYYNSTPNNEIVWLYRKDNL